jgi:hypothetical protein
MKKLSIITLIMIALVGSMAITVWAASPRFLKCSASGVNDDGTLNVCFKIAGLGSNQTLTVTASATADDTYGCLNHGQQCPNAAIKCTCSLTSPRPATSLPARMARLQVVAQ